MNMTKLFLLLLMLSAGFSAMGQGGAACDGSGAVSISGTTTIKPKCNGGNDGSISLAVSGPAGASFTYTLTGAASNPPAPAVTGSTSYSFGNLEAIGFYVLEVRTPVNPGDPNTNYYSCVQIINMLPPDKVEVNVSTEPPTCNTGSDGSASLTITNGTAPYSVAWSNGGSGMNATGLTQGTYTANVTDANGCTGSGSATITDPPPITVTPEPTSVSCNGDEDGAVSFTASGGTAPYTYNSSSGATSNLSPGSYSVTATDANGCTATESFTIAEPQPISATIDPIDPLKCNGDTDRDVTITGTGGTPGYTYTMGSSNEQQSGSNATFGNNGEGSGTITIEDSKGCSASVAFSITGPPPIEFGLDMKKDNCSEGSGYIKSLTPATGGNGGPYTYDYSANGSPYSSFTPPQDFAATDGITTKGDNVTVKVTDKDGCVSSFGSTIENLPRAVPYIRINRNPCIGDQSGSIDVDSVMNNAAVPAFTFYLAKDNGQNNFVSQPGGGALGESAHFSNLSTGGYIMQIEDGKPCGPYAISEFYLWNGTGYELITSGSLYTRDDGTGVDTVSASSFTSPDYAVMQVIEPDPFELTAVSNASDIHGQTGVIWVYDIKGGTPKKINGNPAYLMSVDNPDNMQYHVLRDTIVNSGELHNYTMFAGFAPGMHIVYISDEMGCKDTVMVMIAGDFFIPNLITPNGDGRNDVFEIVSLPAHSTLKIVNRWGDRVYHHAAYDNTFAGTNLSDGVYYYELELLSGQRFKGWVEILR